MEAPSSFEERLLRRLQDVKEVPSKHVLSFGGMPSSSQQMLLLRTQSRMILFATGLLVGIAVTMLVQMTPTKISTHRTRTSEDGVRASCAEGLS